MALRFLLDDLLFACQVLSVREPKHPAQAFTHASLISGRTPLGSHRPGLSGL